MTEGTSYEERLQGHVRAVSDAANAITSQGCKELAQLFAKQHRTIQQNLSRLAIAWFEELAKPETRFDLRNEASVRLAREFVEKVKERGLPYI